MDQSHRRGWLLRLPLWGAFIALFISAMWCNVCLIGLVWTNGLPTESASENWYTQVLFVSLVGSGCFFCLALICGRPRSARASRQRKHCNSAAVRGAEGG